jgi:dCMP deaminase
MSGDGGSPIRPTWEEYFMAITLEVSHRSTCLRRHTGAVLVKDRRILSTGYNGTPRGLAHCADVGCLRQEGGIASGRRHELCRGIHAEQNAIIQAAVHGVAIEGASLYSTHQPCVLCAKMLINAGVTEIAYVHPYPDELSERMFAEAGVRLRRIPAAGEEPGGRAVEEPAP